MNDQKLKGAVRSFRISLIVYIPVDQRKACGDKQPYQKLFDKWGFSVWERLTHEPFLSDDSGLETIRIEGLSHL